VRIGRYTIVRTDTVQQAVREYLGTPEARHYIAKLARSEAKDYIAEWDEVQKTGERLRNHEPVTDGEMNIYNLHRSWQPKSLITEYPVVTEGNAQ
jgi:hypothetical protein